MASETAAKILERAETELRDLIQEVLKEGRYADVATIARLADGISHLKTLNGPERFAIDASDQSQPTKFMGAAPTAPQLIVPSISTVIRRRNFPRFEREGDRLVKIAWSKHHRAEYEHKAPREVIDLLLKSVGRSNGAGGRFVPHNVFPLNDKAKREIPSYQAYLALAWLCHEGVVIKHGRNGYSIKQTAATVDHLNELWEALPSRG